MEPRCIQFTELPGTSRLFLDFLYDFEKVRHFYGSSYAKPSSYAMAAASLRYPDERRAALIEALRQQNGDHP